METNKKKQFLLTKKRQAKQFQQSETPATINTGPLNQLERSESTTNQSQQTQSQPTRQDSQTNWTCHDHESANKDANP